MAPSLPETLLQMLPALRVLKASPPLQTTSNVMQLPPGSLPAPLPPSPASSEGPQHLALLFTGLGL